MRFICSSLLALLLAPAAWAQHAHAYAPPPDVPKSWAKHLWFEKGPFVQPYDMGWGKEIQFPITTKAPDTKIFFQQGWALLAADWKTEAVRSLRQALYQDPTCAMALWSLAMAHLTEPAKAKTFLQEIPKKAALSKVEAAYISALKAALEGESEPNWSALATSYSKLASKEAKVAAIWVAHCYPKSVALGQLEGWLEEILAEQPKHPIRVFALNHPKLAHHVQPQAKAPLPEILAQARRFSREEKAREALAFYGKALPELAGYGTLLRQVPSRWPRYIQALSDSFRLLSANGHPTEASLVLDHLQALPRHPADGFLTEALKQQPTSPSPSKKALGDLSWVRTLKFDGWPGLSWDLPTTTGERIRTADFLNRDVLLIFYLGKGCVHCMEQLQAFTPEADAYQKAGIEIVAVSLDSIKGLKDTLELADPPFPFPLVSDDALAIFRAYDAYDPFDRSPVHGTFFVSKSGKVQWGDVGHEPFMKPRWLLEECLRLQKLDTTLPAIEF